MGTKGYQNSRRGHGGAYHWICMHLDYAGDDCLTFPFSRDTKRGVNGGRGIFGHLGRTHWAHRFMCELAHGKPPTPKHVAAHSCGKGHEGCVNPRHLSWKTQAENLADASRAGTAARHSFGNRGRMTPEQVQYVKEMKGVKPQLVLAQELGMSEGAISGIWRGKYHARPSKIVHWTPEEDAVIKKMLAHGASHQKIADTLPKRSLKAVSARIERSIKPTQRSTRNRGET